MSKHFDANTLSVEKGSRKFIVTILSRDGKKPQVQSCEVTQQQFWNRTSFTSKSEVRDIFADPVAYALEEFLDALSLKDNEIITLPDFILELPGLVLAGAQVMATHKPDGAMHVNFRFQFFLGCVNHAFQPDVGFDDFVCDQNTQTSTLFLSDIAMPLLDLCNAAEIGLMDKGGRMGAFGKSLAEKSHEIKFQIELIKRYVAGLDRAKTLDLGHAQDQFPAFQQ